MGGCEQVICSVNLVVPEGSVTVTMGTSATLEQILRLARRLSPEERAQLRAALAEETIAYPEIAPEVAQMIAGKTAADFIVAPEATLEETLAWLRARAAGEGVDAEDEAEGADWDEVLRGIDAARHSPRLLFPELQDRTP